MLRIFSLAIAMFAVASFQPLTAQCAQIANTGCPGTHANRCVTEPRIGTVFTVRCHPCSGQHASFVVVGTPLANPVILGAPVTCDGQRCGLGCQPVFVLFPEDSFSLNIPNNTSLVGSQLCVQCGCLELTRPTCLELDPATRATVQR